MIYFIIEPLREVRMKKPCLILFLMLLGVLLFSCKPINIFSPLVDPSKMGNDAKLDAGYNALAEGNYDKAIDYFTDVINSASGDDLVDAYLGRGAAYLRKESPNIDSVVDDLISGNLEVDNPGAIVSQVVAGGNYTDFFNSVKNAASDYNAAVSYISGDVDIGILFEVYQTNMMAATGVGAQTIAYYWDEGGSYPGVTNTELDLIVDELSGYTYHVGTWDDPTPANNGLNQHVDTQPEDAEMMTYLINAYNALDSLKTDPLEGMTVQDVTDMQTGIVEWAYYGLSDSSLGTP